MELGKEILYLSAADIAACAPSLEVVEGAVEAMFAAKAAGRTVMKPKLALSAAPDALFLGAAGVLREPPYAGLKWAGILPADRDLPLAHISGLVVLNDYETGMPVAAMDAAWITGARTAAITALAARHLARPEARAIGFVACGVQARAHLEALARHFPLERVRAYSRRLETAERFAAEARRRGLAATAVETPREAVEDVDIVITSVPVVPRIDPFLDAGWLAPGVFAGIVDLGFFWLPESYRVFDRLLTDDLDQAVTEGMSYSRPYDGEVAGLVAGTTAGRRAADERTGLVFAGIGLADVAVGAVIYERAMAAGIGRALTL